MPKWLHDKLAKQALELGISKQRNPERYGAYVYGTLAKYEARRKRRRRRRPAS